MAAAPGKNSGAKRKEASVARAFIESILATSSLAGSW